MMIHFQYTTTTDAAMMRSIGFDDLALITEPHRTVHCAVDMELYIRIDYILYIQIDLPICYWQISCKCIQNAFLRFRIIGTKQMIHFLVGNAPLENINYTFINAKLIRDFKIESRVI